MTAILKVRRSYTAATPPVGGQLADGQLAVNLTDKTIFIGGPSNTVVQLTSGPATLSGDVTGTQNSNGGIVATLANSGVVVGTYTKVTVDAKGRVTTGAQLAASDVNTALGYTAYNGATNPLGFVSSVAATGDATGTSSTSGGVATLPLTLTNSGVTAGTYTKVTVDAKGRVTVGANLASSDVTTALGYTPYNGATNPNGYITTNQAITISGDATGTGTTAIALTLANSGVSAGVYRSVTVDAKGRVTAGTNPTTIAGYGIVDALSSTTAGSASGTITFTSGATVVLPTPVNATDGANKGYVDSAITSAINGVNWKKEVKAVSTSNITLSGTQTIDAYAAVVGDRILVSNQTDATTNGIYVVAAGAWTRSADATTGAQIWGLAVLVLNGTASALSQWVNTNQNQPVVGTDSLTFGRLTAGGQVYVAGTGLTLTGTTFSITNTGVTAGTYTKVTVNAQGQVTTGAALAAADVNTALGYTAYNGTTNPSGFITSVAATGDATGSSTVTSGAATVALTLAASGVTAGTYTKVTVDTKGRVTVGASLASSDVTTALGFTPYNGTTNPNGFITSVALTGDATGTSTTTAGAASVAVTLANSGVTAGTYTKVTVDAKGRVTTGAAIASSDVTTALGYTPFNKAGDTLTGTLNWAPPVTLASAATVAIGAAASNAVTITGTTTITAFDTVVAGAERYVQFTGVLTLTNNNTSLALPGGANITTTSGDVASFVSLGGGNWKCMYYTKVNGGLIVNTLSNTTINGFIEGGAVASSTTFAPDFTVGTDFEYTTTGNATITLPAAAAGRSYTITVIYGGAHTVTFAGGTLIKYSGGTAPVATSVSGKRDFYVCKCDRAATSTSILDGGRNF